MFNATVVMVNKTGTMLEISFGSNGFFFFLGHFKNKSLSRHQSHGEHFSPYSVCYPANTTLVILASVGLLPNKVNICLS